MGQQGEQQPMIQKVVPVESSRQRVVAEYHRTIHKRIIWIIGLILLLLIGIVVDVMTGPAGLSLKEIFQGLIHIHDPHNTLSVIMWNIRLPTALFAVMIGASLSLAGAEMQTILSNPLASPFTLGVSSAAAFGAALAIVLGITLPFVPKSIAVPVNAFIMSFGAVLLIQAFAIIQRGPTSLILFGIALVFGFNALVAVIQFIAPADSLQQLVFWTMGGLDRADGSSLIALVITLAIIIPFSMKAAMSLTLLSLGEERASSLGVNIRRLRFGCLFRTSILAAVSVAFAGTIGFIGLVGPHIARLIVGEDHRFFLPAALLSGAIIMSFASILSKIVIPGVLLPIGIVTSLIGLPCFIFFLIAGKFVR
ncbi:ABC-type Fe3+-siderophore transport system [Commensalibacter communis]|nr:ABC-type Fe3+-siderophore transport system [Commensalibacter communis]